MKTRTKLEVKSQRPKRYIRSDAGATKSMSASSMIILGLASNRWGWGWKLGTDGRTDAESEEEE